MKNYDVYDNNIIGNRAKTAREHAGLSQDELAKTLGYKSRTSINKIETGKSEIRQSKLLPYAKAIGVSPVWLLGLTDDTKNDDTLSDMSLECIERFNKLSEEEQAFFLDWLDTTLKRKEQP